MQAACGGDRSKRVRAPSGRRLSHKPRSTPACEPHAGDSPCQTRSASGSNVLSGGTPPPAWLASTETPTVRPRTVLQNTLSGSRETSSLIASRKRLSDKKAAREPPDPGGVVVLVAKALTKSDTAGRVILPRVSVESNLSFLTGYRSYGLPVRDREGRRWDFVVKSWANGTEHRRVYVLEHALEFISARRLREGDAIGLCADAHGALVVEANSPAVRSAVIRPMHGITPATLQIPAADSSQAAPLISGEPGRCTRNTSCSKPAGHPGFCSGPRAAAAVTAWHSRQGSPSRAGGRTRSDGSPQRPSRSRQRLLHTPSGKPDAECPKAVPSENPVSCEELAAATPDMKAEAQTLHNHQPQVHTEKEEREEESAQLIANQDQPPNAPPRQAGVAEEGMPMLHPLQASVKACRESRHADLWPLPAVRQTRTPSPQKRSRKRPWASMHSVFLTNQPSSPEPEAPMPRLDVDGMAAHALMHMHTDCSEDWDRLVQRPATALADSRDREAPVSAPARGHTHSWMPGMSRMGTHREAPSVLRPCHRNTLSRHMLAYRDAPGWQYLSPAAQDEAAAAAREASWLAESAAELAAAQVWGPDDRALSARRRLSDEHSCSLSRRGSSQLTGADYYAVRDATTAASEPPEVLLRLGGRPQRLDTSTDANTGPCGSCNVLDDQANEHPAEVTSPQRLSWAAGQPQLAQTTAARGGTPAQRQGFVLASKPHQAQDAAATARLPAAMQESGRADAQLTDMRGVPARRHAIFHQSFPAAEKLQIPVEPAVGDIHATWPEQAMQRKECTPEQSKAGAGPASPEQGRIAARPSGPNMRPPGGNINQPHTLLSPILQAILAAQAAGRESHDTGSCPVQAGPQRTQQATALASQGRQLRALSSADMWASPQPPLPSQTAPPERRYAHEHLSAVFSGSLGPRSPASNTRPASASRHVGPGSPAGGPARLPTGPLRLPGAPPAAALLPSACSPSAAAMHSPKEGAPPPTWGHSY